MRKMFFGMLVFLVWSAASMHGQVLIGAQLSDPDAIPHDGAVLDLQSGNERGLLLPQVTLTSATVWAPLSGSAVDGMTVFNLSEGINNGLRGKGVYVWVQGGWRLMHHTLTCEGAIIKNGAYSGPGLGVYTTGLNLYVVDWEGGHFNALNKDLCWNKENVSAQPTSWLTALSICTGDWRLPNLKELDVLYKALDSTGPGKDFNNLQLPHSNPGGADNMGSYRYWSSTEDSSDNAYGLYFLNGNRPSMSKLGSTGSTPYGYIRCVRTLEP